MLSQKFFMRSEFGNSSSSDHRDAVRDTDSREAVRDHDPNSSPQILLQFGKDRRFRFWIER